MDVVGTYLAVPLISGIFNVLIDRLATEDMKKFLMGRDSTNALLAKLKKWMIVISKVASDAEGKQRTDPLVKDWLGEVKDAVYDAEDLIDEIHTEALRRMVESETESSQGVGQLLNSITANLGRITVSLDPFHEGLNSKIEIINQKLEESADMINVLGLKAAGVETSRTQLLSSRSQTVSLVDESIICGRDSEREQIFRILQDGVSQGIEQGGLMKTRKFVVPLARRIPVVAIVGMSGIGKTTLAQLIFNDPRCDAIFDFKSWTWVPDVFDVFQITSSILDLLPEPSRTSYSYTGLANNSLELIQKRLRERVVGKRFLIVLDDLWDENLSASWQALCLSLQSAAPGSAFLVTTQNENIARLFHPIYTLALHELADDDCLSLIKAHALGDPFAAPDERLEDVCKQVSKKCRGLPLAANALGGLLSFTSDAIEWEDIANNRIWDLPSGQKEILPALLLSYNFLPPHLKRCFAYCSVFPKTCQLEKEKLVLLWIAEGLIDQVPNHTRRTEDYFQELLARSFFQESSSSKHSFVMHDLIHELAVYVMGDFAFFLGPNASHVASRRLRHFSYMQSKYETSGNFGPIANADRLRTFLPVRSSSGASCYCLSNNVLQSLEPLFTRLRVLSLCNYKISSMPSSIGSLKHLRYLDFSSTPIEELPESVCSLSNLQTLLLTHCRRLKRLPTMIRNLICLRHLDLRGTGMLQEMPEHIGKLGGLQTLTNFVVGKNRSESIRELGGFPHLRGRLSISGLENVVAEVDASAANLRDKAYLDELVLNQRISSADGRQKEIFDKLKPHAKLRRLTVVNYEGKTFPEWVGDNAYLDLEVLRLEGCPNCTELPPLGQLPSLKHLEISDFNWLVTVGSKFYGQDSSFSTRPFKSLETLKFTKMLWWKTWSIYEGDDTPFPCLQELHLRDCEELGGRLPLKIPSLKVLKLENCRNLSGSLPLSPLLCEVSLQDFGSVDLSSIAALTHLTSLSLRWDREEESTSNSVASARAAISLLTSLESLTLLHFCKKSSIPEGPWFIPPSVRSVTVNGIHEFEASIISFPCLQYLAISSASAASLQFLAAHSQTLHYLRIHRFSSLKEFTVLLEGDNLGLTSLYDLSIERCNQLCNFPDGGFLAANLTTLSIHRCHHLGSLPGRWPVNFPSLQFLSIDDCKLESFPEDDFPLHLRTLCIKQCQQLRLLPEAMSNCTSLQLLDIDFCPKLESFPVSSRPPNLRQLKISGCRKLKIPSTFVCLEVLHVSGCSSDLFQDVGLPSSLQILHVSNCTLNSKWQLQKLHSLSELAIKGVDYVDYFPEDGLLPPSLTFLSMVDFGDLSLINCSELQRLPYLRELEIKGCGSLRKFSRELPQSLCRLTITGSPLLEERCQGPDGTEWGKISHITCTETSP